MTVFESALKLWIAYLTSLGFAADAHLNAGASMDSISSVESEIGFDFPADLKELYLIADGQRDFMPRDKMRKAKHADGSVTVHWDIDASPGTHVGPFFGSYSFLSLEQVLKSYQNWQDISKHMHEDDMTDFIHVREGDPVDRRYWKEGWLPIGEDGGGNALAVDLVPLRGGTIGQIIIFGPDEDERRVLAPSISDLFNEAAQHFAANPETAQLEYDNDSPLVFFSLEWNASQPNADNDLHPEDLHHERSYQQTKMQQSLDAAEDYSSAFRDWLLDNGESDTVQQQAMQVFPFDPVWSLHSGLQDSLGMDSHTAGSFNKHLFVKMVALHDESQIRTAEAFSSKLTLVRKWEEYKLITGEQSQVQHDMAVACLTELESLVVERRALLPWFESQSASGYSLDHIPDLTLEQIRERMRQWEQDFRIYLQVTRPIMPYEAQVDANTIPLLSSDIEDLYQTSITLALTITSRERRAEALLRLKFLAEAAGWQALVEDLSLRLVELER